MTKKINTAGLLPLTLARQHDGSVKGVLPGGKIVKWDKDDSGKPTRAHKRVMLNCCWWRAEWVAA